jgi:hypothetical protein
MKKWGNRLKREKQTLRKMAGIYCRSHHQTREGFCPECLKVLNYALERVDRCPFGEGKPTCTACPVHCHEPAMRRKIRQVMRYSGPRMLVRHPLLALLHILDGLGKKCTLGKG